MKKKCFVLENEEIDIKDINLIDIELSKDIEPIEIEDAISIKNKDFSKLREEKCGFFTKNEFEKLKNKVLNQKEDDKFKKRSEQFMDMVDKLLNKFTSHYEQFFRDRNIVGEELPQYFDSILSKTISGSLELLSIIEGKETPSDRLVKAMQAESEFVDSCIKNNELVDIRFKTSDEVLNAQYKKLMYELEEIKNKIKISNFESNDDYLNQLYKSEYYKAKALSFEANEDMLNAKYKILQLQEKEQEMKIKLQQFESSDAVLELKKKAMEYEITKSETAVKQLRAQTLLVLKQKDGFALEAKVKMLGILLDAWKTAFVGGTLEEIPSVVSHSSIAELFKDLNHRSDGFSAGVFKKEIRIIEVNDNGDNIELKYQWDSGIEDAICELNIEANHTNVIGYPVRVANKGTHSVIIPKPTDGSSGEVTATVFVTKIDFPEPNGDEICCEITCNVLKTMSSQISYKIRVNQQDGGGNVNENDEDNGDIFGEAGEKYKDKNKGGLAENK